MTEPADTTVRHFRAPDDLWKPLVEVAKTAEKLSAADILRRLMADYLQDYRVFWAPEHPDVDSEQRPVAWYECNECDDVHRVSGVGAPWGCSVVKARQDRLDKAAS